MKLFCILAVMFLLSRTAMADDSTVVTLSAMADVAYSLSFNSPPDHSRSYTTQPSRDREIGLLLGHLSLSVASDNFRGRIAVQEGWFTRANYLGADTSWRNLQEASVGMRVADGLWFDGGIMFSHIGYESMIARENLTLGRSFTSDYTPYYSTGASVSWSATANLTITGLVLNGWQQIVDVNSDLSIGTRVFWAPSSSLSVNWSTYYGNDQPTGAPPLMRFHNNLYAEIKPTDQLTFVALADLCLQDARDGGTNSQWYTGVIAGWSFSKSYRCALRAEHYADPDRIFIIPKNGTSFQTTGLSATIDVRPTAITLLRCELRTLMADEAIFPNGSGYSTTDTYITVSTSITFAK